MSCTNKNQFNPTFGDAIFLHLILTRYSEPFPVEWAEEVEVNLISRVGQRLKQENVTINNDGTIDVEVPEVPSWGEYGVEVRGTFGTYAFRSYVACCINYSYSTKKGGTDLTVTGDPYDISMEIQMNAPYAADIALMEVHNNSEESHPYILGLISDINASLLNYYTKQQTYSQTEIDAMLQAINQFTYQVVDVLPEPSVLTINKIYLVKDAEKASQGGSDIMTEYITVYDNNVYRWEVIGNTAIALEDYPTIAQMNAAIYLALDNYYNKAQVNELLANTVSAEDIAGYTPGSTVRVTGASGVVIEGNNGDTTSTNYSAVSATAAGVSVTGTSFKWNNATVATQAYADAVKPTTAEEVGAMPNYNARYFAVEMLGNGTITFTRNNLKYSTDGGKTWTTLNAARPLNVNSGDIVMLKASNPTINSTYGIGTLSSTADFNVSGNIMSLLYNDNFEGQTSLNGKSMVFVRLFSDNTHLKSAKNLILPATTLAQGVYDRMFYGCTGMVEAPEVLPAPSLVTGCYEYMFYNCSALKNAPKILATNADGTIGSCTSMFYGCSQIEEVELLMTPYGYAMAQSMFENCSSLRFIKCLTTDISAPSSTSNWVKNVSATGTFVKADSMESWTTGVNGIPSGWNVYTESQYSFARKYEVGDQQVQSDWAQTDDTAPDYIKDKPNLSTVATSGSYNDLTNKPTIPTVPTISTNIVTDATSDTKTASPKAVKTYVDNSLANVVYSGPVVDSASSVSFDPQADTVHVTEQSLSSAQQQQARENIGAAGVNDVVGYQIVNHGTSDTGSSQTSYSIAPNKLHVWGEVEALYLTLATGEVGYVQEYMIQFESGATATTLDLPSTIQWINNVTPSDITSNYLYQISILNGVGVIGGVDLSSSSSS